MTPEDSASSSCSESVDVDVELLQLFSSRIDKCRRDRDVLKALLRKHSAHIEEIDIQQSKAKAAKAAALEAVDAKKRVLEADLNRRYSAAVESILLGCETQKIPLRQRKMVLKRSEAQVEAALNAVEKKMLQKQTKFMGKYVSLMKEVDDVIETSTKTLKGGARLGKSSKPTPLEDFRSLVLKPVRLKTDLASKVEALEDYYCALGDFGSDKKYRVCTRKGFDAKHT